MAQFKLKQYMFTFEGGGWNTVWAKTKAGAIKAAMLEYKDSDSLNPRKRIVPCSNRGWATISNEPLLLI